VVRWKGHFPQLLLPWNVDELLKSASITETIVVVADIRKSQDLMTYGKNADSYSRHIVQFIETSRQLIDESMGIFDKPRWPPENRPVVAGSKPASGRTVFS